MMVCPESPKPMAFFLHKLSSEKESVAALDPYLRSVPFITILLNQYLRNFGKLVIEFILLLLEEKE